MSNVVVKSQLRRVIEGAVLTGVAYLLVRAFWSVSDLAGPGFDSSIAESIAKMVLWGCGGALMASWLASDRAASALGFGGNPVRAIGFGLASTLPMVAVLLVTPGKSFSFDLALGSGVLGPFAEEFLFRGVVFGLLWRAVGWPAPVAIAVSAILFGTSHQISVWSLAAGGAVLGWVAWRWNSLWPAVALHGLMNVWWDLGRGDFIRRGIGPDLMSVAQLLSVGIAIALTFRFSSESMAAWTRARAAAISSPPNVSPATD